MQTAVFMVVLLALMALAARKKHPVSLDDVRFLATRENLELFAGDAMHCRIKGRALYCEYTHVPAERDRLLVEVDFRKGKLLATFEYGRLLQWSDEKGIVHEAEHCRSGDAWLWESILGTVQNVVAVQERQGAQKI